MLRFFPTRSKGFSWKHNAFAIFVFIIFGMSTACAEQIAKVSPAGTKMLVYTPPAYASSSAKHPVLVFLHGAAEIGDDITLLTKTPNQLPPKLIFAGQWNISLPFIVVSPQLRRNRDIQNPFDQEWKTAYIDEVVEYIRWNYRVDATRIYFTGISKGALACWRYAAAHPSKVAAISPICGGSDPAKAALLKDIPVWAFHGENDALIPAKLSIDMINAIKNKKGSYKPRLTMLLTKGHEGWNELYTGENGYDLYHWFLNFRKGSMANIPPYVNAGADQTILIKSTTHTIAGDFFDWNGSISSIKWKQSYGLPVSLSGTNGAFLQLNNLKAGVYEFQLTVSDNSGGVASDKVRLEVVNPAAVPAVMSLILMNAKANTDIGIMKDGMIVNRSALGTEEFNVRAIVSPGVASVRFRINADQSVRTVSGAPFTVKKQSNTPEWIASPGTCVLCATPYTQPGGKGAAGASLCYRITFAQPAAPVSIANAATRIASPEQAITIKAIDDIIVSSIAEGNQWVHNGMDIPGATGPIFKPAVPGEYLVRDITRTESDVSNLVSFNIQPNLRPKVEVVPDQAQDYIKIKADGLPRRSSYRILRDGMTVQQGELHSDDMKIPMTANLTKGSYILVLNGRKGNEGVKFTIR